MATTTSTTTASSRLEGAVRRTCPRMCPVDVCARLMLVGLIEELAVAWDAV